MEQRLVAVTPGLSVPSTWSPAHASGRPCFVLAPGAGSRMTHPFLRFMNEGLVERGFAVVLFDFPYMAAGRRIPDPVERLVHTWRAVVAAVRTELGPVPLFLGGRSMGARIASLLVAGGESAAGLVLLGYPLQPAGRPHVVRSAHLGRIHCPVLFVQGTRDPLCDLGILRQAIAAMPAAVTLKIVEEADHSFNVPRAAGRSREQVWEEILAAVLAWTEPPGTELR